MVVTVERLSENKDTLSLKVACTAHTDGTFDNRVITTTEAGISYYSQGYYLYEVVAINPASGYPTVGGQVVITDANGYSILPAGGLTLSTSASTKTEATISKYRPINTLLTIAVGDTGSAANTFDLYIRMAR